MERNPYAVFDIKEYEQMQNAIDNNNTKTHVLENYLFGPQFVDIESRMMNAVTMQELEDIWAMNKSVIKLMRDTRGEHILYDLLVWHKKNLTSLFETQFYERYGRGNVSAKNKTTKGP